uniref:Ubiquitin carboxyl-terminal hydrolase CYLD n=1 Tax=Mastacembelus armatus TaxID=205130 RepID=A0A3Q3MGJ3_9TELE
MQYVYECPHNYTDTRLCACVSVQCPATSPGLCNMTSADNVYFIVTEKHDIFSNIKPGCICYMHKSQHTAASKKGGSPSKLKVTSLDSYTPIAREVDLSSMRALSAEEAGLLLALPDASERLNWFMQRDDLQMAQGLTKGTGVTVEENGKKLRGIIRYIGKITEPAYPDPISGTFFGIELQGEHRGKGQTDGSYLCKTLFSCERNCGVFAPFARVKPLVPSSLSPSTPEPFSQQQTENLTTGDRVTYFINDILHHGMVVNVDQDYVWISTVSNILDFQIKWSRKKLKTNSDTEQSAGMLEAVPPLSTDQVNQILIGRMKGIQGHCNSCYMDAALFGLFSCSSVLDSMLFKSTAPQDAPIQKTLLRDIVNPLRRCIKGFVEGRHVMKLRQQLQKHGYSGSFTTDEKDPEEFLIVIMHHILALDPLLKLSAGGKVQESYCYQIFLDQNHSLVLPTVQQLLEHSFHSAGLKLAEVPSCLILQMPRFGKKFKMFDKIIPSLELDITDLLSEGPQQCILCGNLAEEECTACFKDSVFSQTGFKVFCKTCSSKVHSHPQRRSHQPAALDIPKGYLGHSIPHTLTRDKLELFAVLCIETSHYVSFIKYGPKNEDWIFFDSMADRQGERDGFNIPEVYTCPEVGMYLEMSPAELANQVPRDMKGVAKRLFCDAYMYLYQSTNMCLYR